MKDFLGATWTKKNNGNYNLNKYAIKVGVEILDMKFKAVVVVEREPKDLLWN